MSEKLIFNYFEIDFEDIYIDLKKFEDHCSNNDINMEEYFPTIFTLLQSLEKERIRIQLEKNQSKSKKEIIKQLRESFTPK